MKPLADNPLARVWRRLRGTGRAWGPAALFALLGIAAVLASILPGRGVDDGWMRDLLLTIGSSLALFAPLYFITRTLDSHLGDVQMDTRRQVAEVRSEAAAAAAAVKSNFETLQADVDRKLAGFSERVSAKLRAEAAADSAAFDSLRTDEPTRQTIFNALDRADQLGLITTARPPRVKAREGNWLYVSIQFDPDDFADHMITMRVEDTDGSVLDSIPWESDKEIADDVMLAVGRAVRKRTGDEFVPASFLVGLADLLDAASTNSERRPAVELCGSQWMVCDWGVATSNNDNGAYPYGLQVSQIRPPQNLDYVYGKEWVDADSFDLARAVALELFPQPIVWDFGAGKKGPSY